MKRILILLALILLFISCQKREWGNPFDPNCPKELFTPTSFTTTQMGDSIVLSWSQPNNQISGFVLEKNTADGSFTQLAKPEKSIMKVVDRNIEGGIKYGYQLYASAGSNNSNTVTAEITPLLNATISTTDFINITATSAIAGGNITADGGAAITVRGVCWSTTENPTITNSKTTDGSGKGSFTSNLTGLTAGTTYYARSYAINSVGTVYGNQITTTTVTILPSITTTTVSAVTANTATSGGNITSDGGAAVTARGVCWSTVQNPTTANSKTNDSAGSGSFISNITGLTPGATYYIRAFATNSVGTVYGNQITTTTTAILPVITTTTISAITSNSAISGGNITNDGGSIVTACGVCWSTSQSPTITDNKTINSTGIGSFTSNITGLIPGTTYYLRSYAANSLGTAYGNQVSFTTSIIVTDIDGNVYHTLTIGSQVWMVENLKTTKYNNGDLIGTTTANITYDQSPPKYQWAYDGVESNAATYGRLYTWYAITDVRGVCPAGWHIPSDVEWSTLTTYLINNGYGYLGNGDGIAKAMAATSGWSISANAGDVGNNQATNNSSGFMALPGGYRNQGWFYSVGSYGSWWSSSTSNVCNACVLSWQIAYNYSKIGKTNGDSNTMGQSVRCLKD